MFVTRKGAVQISVLIDTVTLWGIAQYFLQLSSLNFKKVCFCVTYSLWKKKKVIFDLYWDIFYIYPLKLVFTVNFHPITAQSTNLFTKVSSLMLFSLLEYIKHITSVLYSSQESITFPNIIWGEPCILFSKLLSKFLSFSPWLINYCISQSSDTVGSPRCWKHLGIQA